MVKRALSAVVLVCCLGGIAASAVSAEQPSKPAEPAQAGAIAPADNQVEPPVAEPSVDPNPDGPVAVGQRRGKGSGFWTSDVPTEDHPYRWTYMIIGLAVVALMGLLVLWMIRKNAGTGSAR